MVDKVKMLIRMNQYYKEEVGCVILFEVDRGGETGVGGVEGH